jgi:hypothetical protein
LLPANHRSIQADPYLSRREPGQANLAKQLPGPKKLVPCGERQQGDVPGLLDGAGQAALVCSANAGEPPGYDLAALGHKPLQQPDVAVRDRVDLLSTELADLLAAEELSAAAGSAGGWTATGATA